MQKNTNASLLKHGTVAHRQLTTQSKGHKEQSDLRLPAKLRLIWKVVKIGFSSGKWSIHLVLSSRERKKQSYYRAEQPKCIPKKGVTDAML